jgi:hypothetical protein
MNPKLIQLLHFFGYSNEKMIIECAFVSWKFRLG